MSLSTAQPQKRMSLTAQKAMDFYLELSKSLIDQTNNPLLKAERSAAQAAFVNRGWPSRRDEAWQYTPLNGFLQHEFGCKVGYSMMTMADVLHRVPTDDVIRLVFVDGHFDDSLSDSLNDLPSGLVIETTADLIDLADESHQLGMQVDKMQQEPLALLNTLLFQDGLHIEVAANRAIEMPVHLVHIQTKSGQAAALRHNIHLCENAELTLVEHCFSLTDDLVQMTNHVTDIQVGDYARFKQVVLQDLNWQSFYFGHQWITQGKNSTFDTLYLGLGGAVSRHQNYLDMAGEHAESKQSSICLAQDKQVQDSRTDTLHSVSHGRSQQLHKFVLQDQARGVFNGMIKVAQDAQKTDGQMDNKNLLLSNESKMDSKPQLEIYADDVKCSHGSATGQVDEDQVFYLQARGIRKPEAIRLITEAFLLEPLEGVSNPKLHDWLTKLVQQHLNQLISE